MRSLVALFLLCAFAFAQEPGITGIVVDATTRQPLAGVHITIRRMAAQGLPSDDLYGAMSGKDGRFSVVPMKADVYTVTPQRNGYVYLPAVRGGVTVKSGEPPKDVAVEMSPQAVISGRVLDEYGDPVQSIQVQAIPLVPGTRQSMWASELTDERGQFRMTGTPGKYYVKALTESLFRHRSDDPAIPVYGPTFYPSTASQAGAGVVEVAAGREAAGADVRLIRALSLTISGVVTGNPEGDGRVDLVLSSLDGNMRVSSEFDMDTDGTFKTPGLSPGRYRLLAKQEGRGAAMQSAPAEVQVTNTDVRDVSLALVHEETLSGSIEIEGEPARSAAAEKMMVRLQPDGPFGQYKGAAVQEDGVFHIEHLFPERFRVQVQPLPENAFIKSDEWIDLSRGVGSAGVKVIVNRNGGQIEGNVLGEDGKPFPGPAILVVATTANEIDPRHFEAVDGGAKFVRHGLRPGKYRLFAVGLDRDAGGIEGLKALFAKAPEIEILEGDRIAKDVQVTDAKSSAGTP